MALANGIGSENGAPVKPADRLDLGESVTQGDIWTGQGAGLGGMGGLGGGVTGLYQIVVSGGRMISDTELMPPLPPYWSQARDNALSRSIEYEGFWDIAVSIAVTKATATTFEVEGAVDLQARKGQELFNDHTNGGAGWENFSSQNCEDFLLNDKGAFIEVDRIDNSKPGARVIGLYHLDSHRCWLTGDPDRPVIYQDLHGVFHWMRWWQVFHISDRPNPRNNFFKVGRCAASRAYNRIRYMVAAQALDYQEMTGSKANTLELLSNLPPQQLEGLFQTDKETRLVQQSIVQGNVILGTLLSKDTPGHITIKLRSKPDNWDEEVVLEHTAIWYSDCLGMDKADLKPFTGRMAGTATQSEVSHNKQQGKGLIVYKNAFQWFMSEHVLPTQASFHWIDLDLGQKKQEADLFNTWVGAVRTATGPNAVIMTGDQGLQKLVDEKQLDREFLPQGEDITPGVTLADDEKLLYPAGEQPPAQPAGAGAGAGTQPPAQQPQGPGPMTTAVSQATQRVRDALNQKLGV